VQLVQNFICIKYLAGMFILNLHIYVNAASFTAHV